MRGEIVDNQTAIGLLTLCAFVTVLILLAGYLVIRIMRTSIFGIASMVLRSVTDPLSTEEASEANKPVKQHPAHLDLRAQAKSIDFDAAVASKKGEVVPTIRTTPATPTVSPPVVSAQAFASTPPEVPQLERKRRRRNANNEIDEFDDLDDGGMFEGLLGE
ncbi:MAG: hypothetical protein LCI00_00130 [Chloroflexi bacterium]|nr:hypothetical protein [Chloroflexota bacterium]MCC6894344.1 hypothetical protein [Anaerolineae bacterium]